MSSYIIILQIGAALLLLLIVLVFEQIVRTAYGRRREFWEVIGRPRSFFWAAPGAPKSAYSAWSAMGRFWWLVLFHSPVWITSDERLRVQVRGFRVLYITLFAFFLGWAAVGLWTGAL